jgi:hypothetical protein
MIEVIADDAQFSSSNAPVEWLAAAHRSAGEVMAAMREGVERWQALMNVPLAPNVAASSEFATLGLLQNRRFIGATTAHATRHRQCFRHVAPALLLC